jgi:hypothetical protein
MFTNRATALIPKSQLVPSASSRRLSRHRLGKIEALGTLNKHVDKKTMSVTDLEHPEQARVKRVKTKIMS